MSFFKFPYTSFQQINLDWIMRTMEKLKEAVPLVEQALPIYSQSMQALDDAQEAVSTVTEQAEQALTTAESAQSTAESAQSTAESAQSTAESAQATAQSASDISTTARETAINALANANQALNIATGTATALEWLFINQYDIKDAENHRDITTPEYDVTDLKSGLLLEIVDHYGYYGYGTISFPAPSLRGEIANYYLPNTNNITFEYSPLGSATALRFRVSITHSTDIVEGQTHHFVQFRFYGSSSTLTDTDCYINIYRC